MSFVYPETGTELIVEKETKYQKMIKKSNFLLGSFGIVGTTCRNSVLVSDCINQIGFAGDRSGNFRIAKSYAVFPVGVAATEMRFTIPISQCSCFCIGFR